MKIPFLLFKRRDEILDERDALLRFFRTPHEEFVVSMFLEFRGFFPKRATDTLTELQLCSGPGSV